MGMVVRTNTMALNAYRQLGMNNSAVAKSLEKLSSGFRINRAGDDAAGLAISEKMKAQITGLETASANAQDGISLIQTAEGNLNEVHDMLNRMVELASKSANGTYTSQERQALQDEVDALLDEIDRISQSANFNGAKLLDGSLEDKTAITGASDWIAAANILKDGEYASAGSKAEYSYDLSQVQLSLDAAATGAEDFTVTIGSQNITVSVPQTGMDAKTFAKTLADKINKTAGTTNTFGTAGAVQFDAVADGTTLTLKMKDIPGSDWTPDDMHLSITNSTNGTNNQGEAIAAKVIDPGAAAGSRLYAQAEKTLTANEVTDGMAMKIGDTTYVFAVGADSKYKDVANVIDMTDILANDANRHIIAANRLSVAAANNKNFIVGSTADDATITFTEREGGVDYGVNDLMGVKATAKDGDWTGLIQMGKVDTVGSTSGLTLQIGDTADSFNKMKVSVKDMSTKGLGLDGLRTTGIMTEDNASSAIDTIKTAINSVSTARAGMGALQNRLEHTINNLDVAVENLSAANSRIRDTDMAKEMMNYTKMNVLVQSAQAMLAQANQQPQSVLQLLQ